MLRADGSKDDHIGADCTLIGILVLIVVIIAILVLMIIFSEIFVLW